MLSLNLKSVILAKRTGLSDTIFGDSGMLNDIYYHELDSSTPGVCVVSDDGKLTWSPVKITRSCVKLPVIMTLSQLRIPLRILKT